MTHLGAIVSQTGQWPNHLLEGTQNMLALGDFWLGCAAQRWHNVLDIAHAELSVQSPCIKIHAITALDSFRGSPNVGKNTFCYDSMKVR